MAPRLLPLLVVLACVASPTRLCAADNHLVIRFYCLDFEPGALERIGLDARTGQFPETLPLAKAFALLDQDRVTQVAFSRVDAVNGKEATASSAHKAPYLELAPGGGMVQRLSEWDEGVTVRVTPTIDRDGRVHVEGQYSLQSITTRAPLVGVEKWDLGRPLTHSTQTVNPAVALRPGEARMIKALGSGSDKERVVMVVVESAE